MVEERDGVTGDARGVDRRRPTRKAAYESRFVTDRENARTVIVAGIFLARPGRVRSDVGRGRDIEVQETRGDRVGHFRKRRSNSFVKDT